MYFSSTDLKILCIKKISTYSQFTHTGTNWQETLLRSQSKWGNRRRALFQDHHASFLLSQGGGENQGTDTHTPSTSTVCFLALLHVGSNQIWQQWSQIKHKLVLISRIHLLQRTHITTLLSKYLDGVKPIGNCHVLFASEYTRSFTALRKQIIRPPNSCTFPLERATLCCYISNWNMTGCLCLYSEKSYTDSICSTFGANLQWLLRLKIALEFCLLLLYLK